MFFTCNYNSFDNKTKIIINNNSFDNKMKIIIKDIKNPYNNFNVLKEILQEYQIAILTNIEYFGFFDSSKKKYVNNAILNLLWYYNENSLNIQYYMETFGEYLFNFNDENDVLTFSKYQEPHNIINDALSYINNYINNKKNSIENDSYTQEELQLKKIAYDVAEFVLNENYDELVKASKKGYEYKNTNEYQYSQYYDEYEDEYEDEEEDEDEYEDEEEEEEEEEDEHFYNH